MAATMRSSSRFAPVVLAAGGAAALLGYCAQEVSFTAPATLAQPTLDTRFVSSPMLDQEANMPRSQLKVRSITAADGEMAMGSAARWGGQRAALPLAALLTALAAAKNRLRGGRILRSAEVAQASTPAVEESFFLQASTVFCNLFALWLAIAAVAAVKYPPSFTWVKASYFTGLLGLLMFSVGITTTIDDFKACLTRPGAIAINFIACYGIMPALAFVLAKAMGAEGPILAGMVLVGSINGGQASNLCTLIAGGDVALSVLMTTSTTLGCIFMTPSICKLVLGAVVPVDAMGIVYSTIQVVLAPIFVGVALNTLAPKLCRAVAPFTPIVGVISTVLLVGASVASCAQPILTAGLPLQLACLTLHLLGGILGYFATRAGGNDERTCRTVAIETAMKSSAFGYLLASLHFGAFDVRVPAAVSVVWMAITGSIMAVYWKGKPLTA
mmetsp:Transcript_65774/g.214058  ORF Transcript_65774/g.214058 Transcript_65774/m.214058 type:complete len:442 (+) Transcript_65774:109-1434(+)